MIGIDEVGRGCWAGPLLIVAARAITALPAGLKDSKKLSKKQREALFGQIQTTCQIGEGWVEAAEVDVLGLTGAMKLGVARALKNLGAEYDQVIIMDGHINYCASEFRNVQCVIKADSSHPIVSAASIYAKVLRDKKMEALALTYPDYGFEKHVGYGTKQHMSALQTLGVSEIHRKSYKPVYTIANS